MNSKKSFIVLTASSLLIGSLGVVGAQNTGQKTQTQSQTQSTPETQHYGFGHGFADGPGRGFGPGNFGRGFGGAPFGGHLALGTTVTLEFYDTDPSTAGSNAKPTQTLTFTYGQDSEAAFAQSFAEARTNASYLTVNVGKQMQTLELPSDAASSGTSFGRGDRHGGVYGALPLRALNEGSSVEATFYDGDPAADGQSLQTLSFTYGQDSEAGFADQFASAAEGAAFVTLTTSPQTYTVDLSAAGRTGSFGSRDFGGRDTFRHGENRPGNHR